MAEFNRGEIVVAEIEFQEYTPFSTYAYADPDSTPTITVTDPSNTARVSAQNLTKSDTGKYYYLIQTATSWLKDDYKVTIVSIFNSITNTNVTKNAFKLT